MDAGRSTMRCTAVVVVLAALGLATLASGFKMTVLHTNDMHARFEQTDRNSGKCTETASDACYGGMARLVHAVREYRGRARAGNTPAVLFLNAGDTYQGTAWYTVHKWRIAARFVNLLQFDAISLGNHEFDDGIAGLVPFLDNVTCPVLAANLDLRAEPKLRATHLANSTVLTVNGTRVGIIGYLTAETKNISETENVQFLDEVVSVRREAESLKSRGVNILIAVGHSGYDEDQRIAREVPDIDVVVGGHTNTFLYTGKAPDREVPEGLYPTVVRQSSGRKVLVVQAYAYTKYLGHLEVEFDNQGEVKNFSGNPILLDHKVPQAQDILDELVVWKKAVHNLAKTKLGTTKVFLEGSSKICRLSECNMGNFITDALVDYVAREHVSKGWTTAAIAVQHAGGIRNSIDAHSENGVVTMEDLLGVLPFENSMRLVELKGKHVLEMLEWSVHNYSNTTAPGGFLQVSGLHVTYDMTRKQSQRVVSAKARCADCRVPEFFPVQPEATYSILLPLFMDEGGDGYSIFKQHAIKRTIIDVSDVEMVSDYLKHKSPIYPGIEDRIQFLEQRSEPIMHSTSGGGNQLIITKHLLHILGLILTTLLWVL